MIFSLEIVVQLFDQSNYSTKKCEDLGVRYCQKNCCLGFKKCFLKIQNFISLTQA